MISAVHIRSNKSRKGLTLVNGLIFQTASVDLFCFESGEEMSKKRKVGTSSRRNHNFTIEFHYRKLELAYLG
jgi:hypothetical protein